MKTVPVSCITTASHQRTDFGGGARPACGGQSRDAETNSDARLEVRQGDVPGQVRGVEEELPQARGADEPVAPVALEAVDAAEVVLLEETLIVLGHALGCFQRTGFRT